MLGDDEDPREVDLQILRKQKELCHGGGRPGDDAQRFKCRAYIAATRGQASAQLKTRRSTWSSARTSPRYRTRSAVSARALTGSTCVVGVNLAQLRSIGGAKR